MSCRAGVETAILLALQPYLLPGCLSVLRQARRIAWAWVTFPRRRAHSEMVWNIPPT